MFFIMGITDGRKDFDLLQAILCSVCGRYGQYRVFMTYTVLSLFFIPCFKWNKHYYVQTSCCDTVYELDPEVGKRIARGENLNEKEMPFAIGAHPGFMMPAEKSHVFRLYDRQGNPVQNVENRIFGTGGCITDKTEVINTPDGVLPITDHLFDGDALVIENKQLGAVELTKEGKDSPEITVRFSSPLVGLWSPPKKNAPFVCIEPWYGRCDSESFTGDLQERDHEQILESGKGFMAEYDIIFGEN